MLRFGLIFSVLVLVLDQAAKAVVLGPLGFSPPGCLELHAGCGFIKISSIFDLRMVWNQGVSFGLLRAGEEGARWALVGLQAGIAGLFFWWLRSAERRLTAVALGLVVGGALGNVVDRIRFGAVVDFLDFSGLAFPWVFNVADAAINVGAALLVIDFLRNGEKKSAPTPASAPQNGQDRP